MSTPSYWVAIAEPGNVIASATSTSITFTGLTGNKLYKTTVVGIYGNNSCTGIGSGSIITLPTTPVIGTITHTISNNLVQSTVAFNTGNNSTDYSISYSLTGGTTLSTSTPFLISNLQPSTYYPMSIVATTVNTSVSTPLNLYTISLKASAFEKVVYDPITMSVRFNFSKSTGNLQVLYFKIYAYWVSPTNGTYFLDGSYNIPIVYGSSVSDPANYYLFDNGYYSAFGNDRNAGIYYNYSSGVSKYLFYPTNEATDLIYKFAISEITKAGESQLSDFSNRVYIKNNSPINPYKHSSILGDTSGNYTIIQWSSILDSSGAYLDFSANGAVVASGGTFVVNTATKIYFLLIGGGGSGGGSCTSGNSSPGGGSGGGIYYNNTTGITLQAGTYTVTVGAGGAGVSAGQNGNNGGTTSIVGTGVNISVAGGLGGSAPSGNGTNYPGGASVTSGSGGGTGSVSIASGAGSAGTRGTGVQSPGGRGPFICESTTSAPQTGFYKVFGKTYKTYYYYDFIPDGYGTGGGTAVNRINNQSEFYRPSNVSSGGGGGVGGGYNAPGYPGDSFCDLLTGTSGSSPTVGSGGGQYTSQTIITPISAKNGPRGSFGCGGGGALADGTLYPGYYSGAGAYGVAYIWFNNSSNSINIGYYLRITFDYNYNYRATIYYDDQLYVKFINGTLISPNYDYDGSYVTGTGSLDLSPGTSGKYIYNNNSFSTGSTGSYITISFWLYITAYPTSGQYPTIFSFGTNNNNSGIIMNLTLWNDSTACRLNFTCSAGNIGVMYTAPALNVWTFHLYQILVGTNLNSGGLTYYNSNTLQTSVATTGTGSVPANNTTTYNYIGSLPGAGQPNASIRMDDFRYYNRQLSSTERTNLYNYR
jgi:hypothetical protein